MDYLHPQILSIVCSFLDSTNGYDKKRILSWLPLTRKYPFYSEENYRDDKRTCIRTFCNGLLHSRNDEPAITILDFETNRWYKEWYKYGEYHRDDDQPAVILLDGTKIWYTIQT